MYKELQQMAENNKYYLDWTQFRSCQAWYSNTLNDKGIVYQLVKSYNTIVGIIDHTNEVYVALGKWSRTTSKQQTQIHNSLVRNYEFIQM